MSAAAEVAVLLPTGGRRSRAGRDVSSETDRPIVRLAAFAALGLYGTLRWATMLSPAPEWRLLSLLAVAVVVAGLGSVLAARSLALALALAVIAVIAVFPLAGVPLSWVRHVRIALSANGIGEGLSALPRALVPYNGINEWLRIVIVLGAAVLLLDGALMLAFAPRRLSDVRRAAAALPLVALAVVPSTLNRPTLSYAHGLVLFGLVAAFMWGDRVRPASLPAAGALAALAAAGAMIAAPALDQHSPWLNYQALAGTLAPSHPERFDWSQRYGPLHWPRTGHAVFEVQASRSDYWKTENLEVFDGRGWLAQSLQAPNPQDAIDAATLKRWSQTLHVTIRAMRTTDVIAAGVAGAPDHAGNVLPGVSDGTWTVPTGLGPGDGYTLDAYSPHPTPAQLEAAGSNYPTDLSVADLSLMVAPDPKGVTVPLPGGVAPGGRVPRAAPVYFPPFGLRQAAAYGPTNLDNYKAIIGTSVYAPAYTLARRLLRHAKTPYDYVMSVKDYLSQGFSYNEDPPSSAYPIETFLFNSKRGYCQQFAGAMALLLRMGGVPARVATGFTTGTYDSATHSWIVSDIDAHAWVEAWFPRYGWVRFDPTPAAAPALGGHGQLASIKSVGSLAQPSAGGAARRLNPVNGVGGAVRRHRGGGVPAAVVIVLGVLAAALAIALAATVRLREPTEEELITELERALSRSGRPLSGGTTLAAIERRFRGSAEAQDYVRNLRLARFAGAETVPSSAQRRALRVQLREGLGASGLLRAIWALPPRITLRRGRSKPPPQRIHSR